MLLCNKKAIATNKFLYESKKMLKVLGWKSNAEIKALLELFGYSKIKLKEGYVHAGLPKSLEERHLGEESKVAIQSVKELNEAETSLLAIDFEQLVEKLSIEKKEFVRQGGLPEDYKRPNLMDSFDHFYTVMHNS